MDPGEPKFVFNIFLQTLEKCFRAVGGDGNVEHGDIEKKEIEADKLED